MPVTLPSPKVLVYEALDLATLRRGVRRRYNGQIVRFPPRWARYYPATYEPAKQTFLEENCRAGSTVIDGGAHIGLFTVLMARRVGPHGHVHAFEPTPYTRGVLRRTLALNDIRNVTTHTSALSSSKGRAPFFDTGDPGSNANSLGRVPKASEVSTVPTSTVDSLGLDDVSCIKLDIEGAEFDALVGAEAVMRRDRPAIAMEVHPTQLALFGRSVRDLWDLLATHSAVVFRDGRPMREEQFCAITSPFEVQVILNDS